jgi:formate/nitrite transporter FocA (FNT family)
MLSGADVSVADFFLSNLLPVIGGNAVGAAIVGASVTFLHKRQ